MGTIVVGESVNRYGPLTEDTFTDMFQSPSSRFARPADHIYRGNAGIVLLLFAVQSL